MMPYLSCQALLRPFELAFVPIRRDDFRFKLSGPVPFCSFGGARFTTASAMFPDCSWFTKFTEAFIASVQLPITAAHAAKLRESLCHESELCGHR